MSGDRICLHRQFRCSKLYRKRSAVQRRGTRLLLDRLDALCRQDQCLLASSTATAHRRGKGCVGSTLDERRPDRRLDES